MYLTKQTIFLLFTMTIMSPLFASVPVDVSDQLSIIVKKRNVPGLIARSIDNGTTTAAGVAGKRDRNLQIKMSTNDLVHFGSMFKVQTATLCGILVDAKILDWNSKLIDYVSPELKVEFLNTDPRWNKVTLAGLLSMSSGIDDEDLWSDSNFEEILAYNSNPVKGRKVLAKWLSKTKLREEQGKRYSYSNSGYTMAGFMIETAWNKVHSKQPKTYEELMTEKLFIPLGIKTGITGAPGMSKTIPANIPAAVHTPVTIGHNETDNDPVKGIPKGQPVGLGYADADNPLTISPAGAWSMSMDDYLKLLKVQMQTKQTRLLDSLGLSIDTLNTIQKPVINVPNKGFSFSLGWAVDNKDPNHLIYTGSNNRWVSMVDVRLDTGKGLVAVTNQGGKDAESAAKDALERLNKNPSD